VGFLWDFLDISMIFLWDYYGMSIESKLTSIESTLKSIESKLKSVDSKLKSIENQLKSIEIYHFFDHKLFRPLNLKISTLKRLQKLFTGWGPHTNQH
jgi:hypothetical protein